MFEIAITVLFITLLITGVALTARRVIPSKKARLIVVMLVSILIIVGVARAFYSTTKSRDFQFFSQPVTKVYTQQKVVALTFDDGPTAEYTEEVLAVLDEYGVKGTFFVTGRELEHNMKYGRMIVDRGHELGNHTYSHDRMLFKNYSTIADEIEKTDALIREAGYKDDIYVRSPYCKKYLVFPYYLKKNGRTNVIWDLEPETYYSDAQDMVEYVKANVEQGSIILLHVMYKGRDETRKALPRIIEELTEMGYEFVGLSELVEVVK